MPWNESVLLQRVREVRVALLAQCVHRAGSAWQSSRPAEQAAEQLAEGFGPTQELEQWLSAGSRPLPSTGTPEALSGGCLARSISQGATQGSSLLLLRLLPGALAARAAPPAPSLVSRTPVCSVALCVPGLRGEPLALSRPSRPSWLSAASPPWASLCAGRRVCGRAGGGGG